MSELIEIILIAFFIILSAFFAGSEVSFYSISDAKLQALLKQKKKGANALSRLKKNPKQVINTILICNDFSNIAASSIATILSTKILGINEGLGISIGIMTFLILFFGDMIPKNFANAHSERFALFMSPIILLFSIILYPFTSVFAFLTRITLSVFKIENRSKFSEEEIWSTIEIVAGEKLISESEMKYLEGILRYKDVQTKEVMTPRIKIFALDETLDLKQAAKKIIKKGYTRIPVYQGSIDKITGFVHIIDVLANIQSKNSMQLKKIKRKILYCSEEAQAKTVFSDMQKKRIPISIVLDEFGGTEGLVAMEDLLEEIVGEVLDENDEHKTKMKIVDKDTIIAEGDIKIEFVDSFFKTDVLTKIGNFPDIAAVIEGKLKRFPKKNDCIQIGELYMQVLNVRNNFPVRVAIKNVKEEMD